MEPKHLMIIFLVAVGMFLYGIFITYLALTI